MRNSLRALRCNEMLGVCFQNGHRVTLNCRAMCSLANANLHFDHPGCTMPTTTLLLTFASFAKYISIWVSEASRKARVADVSWVWHYSSLTGSPRRIVPPRSTAA